jgi:diadenylate cyclase
MNDDALSTPLRLPRLPLEDPRRDPRLFDSIARVAPGTRLREGIEDIIRAGLGALIVIGDPSELSFLYSGGILLDVPFTPQLLYELSKMDGAVVVNESVSRLACANVQLVPDPAIPSHETGTRHRTAERVAKQTGALVVSISQERETVTLFVDGHRFKLDRVPVVLARANQELATLDAYTKRMEQLLERLTRLELIGRVVLDDVLTVVQRAEMSSRMIDLIERDCVELGSEGRLIGLQLAELSGHLPAEKRAVVCDYHASGGAEAEEALDRLGDLSLRELQEPELLLQLLAYPRGTDPLERRLSPRGYRILEHVPRLPASVARGLVEAFGGLEAIVEASERDLQAVDGVGPSRAREIREGLRRLREQNLPEL